MGILTGGKRTVLVVEDEPLLRLVAVADIEDAGMVVLEAENANEALQILSAHPEIDLVFTDIDMPGDMDGIALANILRQQYPHIGVIVASGLSNIENTALQATIPFFPKPYDMTKIISQMQAIWDPPGLPA